MIMNQHMIKIENKNRIIWKEEGEMKKWGEKHTRQYVDDNG